MSTTPSGARSDRPMGASLNYAATIDRSDRHRIEKPGPPRRAPQGGADGTLHTTEASTPRRPHRGRFTDHQLSVICRDLERLAALETDRGDLVASVGVLPVAAYDMGIRDAVRDALAKLVAGTYGDCETCENPIPVVRLEAVPYARRCRVCQEREEKGWNDLERMVGGVVRNLAGEPQGRSVASS